MSCETFFPLREPAPLNNALEARVTAKGKVQGVDQELIKDFRVCMPDDLDPNKNGFVTPTPAQLQGFCDTVLVPIAKKMLQDCAMDALKNFTFTCELSPATFVEAACKEACQVVVLDAGCTNLDQATGVFGIPDQVCLAEQNPDAAGPRPMGAALAKRSNVEATEALGSSVTIARAGDDQTRGASGLAELTGDLTPGSAISIASHLIHVNDFKFSALGGLADATLTNVFATSSSSTTATLDALGQAVFGPSTTVTTGGGKLEKPLASDESDRFTVGNAENVLAAIDVANKLCTLDSTTVGDDDGTPVDVITHLAGAIVNQPPHANAGADSVVECTSAAGASFTLDCSGSTDPDGNIVALQWRSGSRSGDALGTFEGVVTTDLALNGSQEYFCNAVDAFAQMSSDSRKVTVSDTTAPRISCNAPAFILPTHTPLSFRATAADTCDPTAGTTVTITGFNCSLGTKKKTIDKGESCVVVVNGATITILDSGGVGDRIVWQVTAKDASGNIAVRDCEVVVKKPGK